MHKEDSRTRKEKALETKDHLYATAEALFTKYGYDDVSVDRIVEEAGLSKGSFYVHFESKDNLVNTLISDYVMGVDMDYRKYIDSFSEDTPAPEILLCLIHRIAEVIVDTIGIERMKILYRTQLTNMSHAGISANNDRMLYNTISDVLSKGLLRKEFVTDLPLEELTNYLVLSMRGLTYEWCIRYPDFDLKAQSQAYFRTTLKGIMG